MTARWSPEQDRLDAAAGVAETIVKGLEITEPPIDPFAIIKSEGKQLVSFGDDFDDAFDGRLEFQSPRFLLFYNTKYDAWPHTGAHHPKVTFTVGHELGHYFLERHHQYLRKGGQSHFSQTEFTSDNLSEREADAFAASLLMPKFLADPIVNNNELSLNRIDDIARIFATSLLATAIRSVHLSDFPCAVAGIRNGAIGWMFPSQSLITAGLYPGKRALESPQAAAQWETFSRGARERSAKEGRVRHWFEMYERDDAFGHLYLKQEFLPIPVMKTLVVLLTIDEDDLLAANEEDD